MGLGRRVLEAANDGLAAAMYLAAARRPRPGVAILHYRRLSPKGFNSQLKAVGLTRGVRIVSLSEVDRWIDNEPPSTSCVMFAFEGGLHEQLHAAAELARYGLAATFFVPLARDREHLDDDAMHLLARMGHDVQPTLGGSRDLSTLTAEELYEELTHTLNFASRFSKPMAIAYSTAATVRTLGRRLTRAIAEHGIRIGITTRRGTNAFRHVKHEALVLRRIPIEPGTPALVAQAKAAGYAGPLAGVELVLSRALGR